ncbi:MAG: helix-turn-helix transcriptional regulator [Comamonadaceae bacterium CG1_02_60_18]|nr:MAG: helix-turn-helix transcriptional regulator [Comamonadaceae bacterium CG1_02_60_18]PIQ51496.1 MAG: helix-turn-helix transcriptional regulator [Comamonadaceae bacterium CG12_big_fil_rev_8_21_14_0_65_59_15]
MLKLDELAWHRAMGNLLESLDQSDFWLRLTRLLAHYVHFDSWVALRFAEHDRPRVLAEITLDDGLPDTLFEDYLNGLYLLDPFFIAACEYRRDGLIDLDDVAPDRFKSTEYYQRYFRINIVEDEIQWNCLVDHDATVCLSLGSHRRFKPSEKALMKVLGIWLVPLLRQRWQHELREQGQSLQRPATHPAGKANFRLSDASLSARELEIARLMLSGFSSKGISQRLGISAETVKVHRKHLYSKLGLNAQHELFALFLKDNVRDPQS